ncbi:MAG TPA: flagellar motor protein [Vicinamibacterales bacterium]|nr:flagellar motor protein [Vicinamibacterales bacterium]
MSQKNTRVDFTSVAGVPISLGLILLGQAIEGGSAGSLLQATAALIVFGGTLGAVLLSFSLADVQRAVKGLRTVFLWDGEPPERTIDTVLRYAKRARKEGIMSLEDDLAKVDDPFLQKGLRLAVDGTDPHAVREMLEIENQSREEHDEIPAKVFESGGGYAPTVGILGAVLGLIHVMQNLADPSKLGAGIAVAFVATVYGVGSANLIFLPIATKLKMKARHEARRRELIVEGIMAIQEGLNPRTIQEKLMGFAATSEEADPRRRAA